MSGGAAWPRYYSEAMMQDKPDLSPADAPLYHAVLRPHRSLGPKGFRNLMLFVGGVSALISLPFFVLGYWPVVGFFGLDVLGLYLCFCWNYRTARAREEVLVTPVLLEVRKVSHWGEASDFRFNPIWVRVEREEDDEFGLLRVAVVERGRSLDVGGFLAPVERSRFADEFTRALAEAKRGPRFA